MRKLKDCLIHSEGDKELTISKENIYINFGGYTFDIELTPKMLEKIKEFFTNE